MADMSAMFRRTPKNSGERLVTLIGKPGCHLCDDAEAVVGKVCGELGVPWEKKDITEDAELHRRRHEISTVERRAPATQVELQRPPRQE